MSYTAKQFVTLSLLTIVLIATVHTIFVNHLVLLDVEKYVAEGRWLEEKITKGRLLIKRNNPPRVVFIGSSQVQNHISTDIFAESGISIFNYGLPGKQLEDYGYMVNQAIESGTRNIVISLPPTVFMRKLGCPKSPTQSDLHSLISVYGWPNKCLLPPKLIPMLPANHYKKFLKVMPLELTMQKLLELEKFFGIKLDAAEINSIRGKPDRYVVTFASGDGIIYSNRAIDTNMQDVQVGRAREATVQFLDYLADKIERAGIKPIVVFGPINYNSRFSMANGALPKNPIYPIIDTTDQLYGPESWADRGHYNLVGRERYSRWLVERLQPLLK